MSATRVGHTTPKKSLLDVLVCSALIFCSALAFSSAHTLSFIVQVLVNTDYIYSLGQRQ